MLAGVLSGMFGGVHRWLWAVKSLGVAVRFAVVDSGYPVNCLNRTSYKASDIMRISLRLQGPKAGIVPCFWKSSTFDPRSTGHAGSLKSCKLALER